MLPKTFKHSVLTNKETENHSCKIALVAIEGYSRPQVYTSTLALHFIILSTKTSFPQNSFNNRVNLGTSLA